MGRHSAICIFGALLNRWQLLKERICFCRSKFFPLRVDPLLEGLHPPGKQGRVTKVVPFIKVAEKEKTH